MSDRRETIGGFERSERNVALRNIEAIAQTLGITLAELLEGLCAGHRLRGPASALVALLT